MNHGSLFSGIGGFDLAAEWMGWNNVFHCEINQFGQKVLKYYWPNSISYDDITKTDFTVHRGHIDILTGGFPCQPYSQAGKRLGKEDDRHLWPEMLRAIREIQPTWIVGENVRGLTNWNGGLVFDEVQADLEAQGYEVTPFLLPACAVNAPHRRDRIWFIAYSDSNSRRATESNFNEEGQHLQRRTSRLGLQWTTTNTERSSITGQHIERQWQGEFRRCYSENNVTDTRLFRQEECQKQTAGIEQSDKGDDITNTCNERLQRCKDNGSVGEIREKSNQFFTGCIPSTWQEFPTQSPICSGDDGLPTKLDRITFPKWRAESIKAYGNAVVPQLVYEIFKAIEKYSLQH